MGFQNDPRQVDEEREEALLAQLEEAFAGDRGGREDSAGILETIQVCLGLVAAYSQQSAALCALKMAGALACHVV